MASALRVQVSPSAFFPYNLTSLPPAVIPDTSLAVVLVSNGPGELATWVRPIAERLHRSILMRPRAASSPIDLRLVLVPCPNATGQEADAARRWIQFEQITPANQFWNLLFFPRRYGPWPRQGVVVFLGGDQFWSVLLSGRLGYRHLTYAEWVARWPRWNDCIAAMSPIVRDQLPRRFRDRCTVVGDLMADLSCLARAEAPLPQGDWVALLPGSKRAKLCVGVPFLLEAADRLARLRPGCRFLLPVAPTTSVKELESFMSSSNPIAATYRSAIAMVRPAELDQPWRRLITRAGTVIYLQEDHPAHGPLSQCDLALPTVGANTAELGALGLPMIVIVPTQHLAVMQAWDGWIGLLARLPGLRWCIGVLLSAWRLRRHGFLAWPNISAGRMVVPERVGSISPQDIAHEAAAWLESPERLRGLREDLRSRRGQPGAVSALVQQVRRLLPKALGAF